MNNIPLKQYWDLLYKYLKPQWKTALMLGLLLFGNIALQLVNPQIIRNFLDAAQAGAAASVLSRAALTFLGLALLQQGVTVLASYFGEIVSWTATNALRIDLTAHCLNLDLSFHNAHTPGEMIERVDGDINNLATFFSRFVVELLGNMLLLAGVLIMLWRENWLVGSGLTAFVSISMVVMLKYRNVAVPHWAAERQTSADFYGFLEERLAGTEDIRANGAEAYVMRKFHALIREMLRKSLKSAMVINVLLNINQFLFAVGMAAAFAIGTYLFTNAAITIGTVYLIYHYTTMLNRPMENIGHQIEHLQRAGAGIVRIRELFAIQNKIRQANAVGSGQPAIPAGVPLGLRFEQVTFGYDDSIVQKNGEANGHKEIVLKNLSFELQPGKVLGLLGRTGSGKTTLTRLLFRFYDPDKGQIKICQAENESLTDIRQLSLGDLRQKVGIVTQNIQLFNASVRDNLTFFDRTFSALGLHSWFAALPNGLDTMLESGGGGLSAGEAQLLAFTRIFLFDPGIVILDEASSRLDPATEHLIAQAVERLIADRTAIIIAHRLGTVLKADDIMILDRGEIEEYGDRQTLSNNPNSRFFQLLQTGLEEVLV